jgi:acyl carrier protein
VILDDHFQLVPVGATGELYIGGKSIARGYLGMQRRTAESFIPDPFSDVPGARLYRSGDLVRWKADRVLEFLGRRDDQVKIRGFLVEPTEVQSALSSLPQVADAIVNIDIDEEGERRLIAYVLASSGHELDTRTLRSTMRQRLPEYLVPSVFMIVDDWPLTNNGKVDRDRLPKPIKDTAQSTSRPETIDQVNLLALINCLLKTKIDGIHDNFFDLGITSLSAMRLVAQIVSKFGRDVSLADVLEYPTVAELADSVAFQTKICDTQVQD